MKQKLNIQSFHPIQRVNFDYNNFFLELSTLSSLLNETEKSKSLSDDEGYNISEDKKKKEKIEFRKFKTIKIEKIKKITNVNNISKN